MAEGKATKKWKEKLEQNGCLILPFVAGMRQRNGLPDRFVGHRRLPSGAWIEIKNETREATTLQKIMLISLLAHGQVAFVLRLDPQGRAMSAEAPEDEETIAMRQPGRLESELDFIVRAGVEIREWYEKRQTQLKLRVKAKARVRKEKETES